MSTHEGEKKVITLKEHLEQKKKEDEASQGLNDEDYDKDAKDTGYYFTAETDKAIAAYNEADEEWEKNRIFREHIREPFEKLVGAIFSRYGFKYFDVPHEDVKQRVLHHLIEKIHMYQEGKGKGFSYFSTIARNKFIQINNKNYKRYQKEVRLDKEEVNFDVPLPRNFEDKREVDDFFDGLVEHWRSKLPRFFSDPEEREVAEAFLQILEKRKELESFNKKNFYNMVREMTGYEDTQLITNVRKKLKSSYDDVIATYRKEGEFETENPFFNI